MNKTLNAISYRQEIINEFDKEAIRKIMTALNQYLSSYLKMIKLYSSGVAQYSDAVVAHFNIAIAGVYEVCGRYSNLASAQKKFPNLRIISEQTIENLKEGESFTVGNYSLLKTKKGLTLSYSNSIKDNKELEITIGLQKHAFYFIIQSEESKKTAFFGSNSNLISVLKDFEEKLKGIKSKENGIWRE